MSHARLATVVVLLATLTAPGLAFADLATRFTHYSVEHGLSQAAVETIIQDAQGYIWIGTENGLNRFDGYRFVTYIHDKDDPQSLAHNWIWALHEDTERRIWVGTDGGGLDRLDPQTGVFEHHALDVDLNERLVVRAITQDNSGTLWIGTDGNGVYGLDPDTGATTHHQRHTAQSDSLSNDHVKALLVSDGYLWIGTDGGVVDRLDLATHTIQRFALDPDHPHSRARMRISSLASAAADALWIGTYEDGLVRLDTRTQKVRIYRHRPDDATSLSADSVRVLFNDASDALWVGTDGEGLNRYDPPTDGFEHVRQDPADFNGLSDGHIVSMYQDRGGVMWVGTYVGVNTWNPRIGTFARVSRRNDGPNELSNNYVTSFEHTPDGSLWIGTGGGGLNRARPSGTISVDRHDPNNPRSLGDDRVFSLAADPPNGLWIGTRSGGLNYLDTSTGQFQHFRHDANNPRSLSFDGVTSLLIDQTNTLWVATYLGGLNRYDRTTGTFQHFRHSGSDPTSLCSDRVVAMAEDRRGQLVVGTHGGGICVLDAARGAFARYQHVAGDASSLSSNSAWAVHVDADDNLWVGTEDGGLNLWRAQARAANQVRFEHYTQADGLASPVVYGILSDATGDIWISSNHGLSRLNPATGRVQNYDISNGLPSNEFNSGAQYRSDDGVLYFGGIAGFTYFRPESIRTNVHPPQIALTRVQIMNRDVASPMTPLVLDYHDQLMTFEYAALDFTAPQRNTYKHRLIGFDETWVDDGALHRATYTNLEPGNYVFQVMAANNDGVWSAQPLTLNLRVDPAPWATPWAKAGYLLLIFGALLLVYRSYSRRLAIAQQIHNTNLQLRTEIAERQAQERALIRERANAQRYLDIVEVMILALDADGVVRRMNQKGTRVLGYSEHEIVGSNFYERLVPTDTRDQVRQQFQAVAQYDYSESTIVAKDGTQHLIAWHTTPLPATEDEPRGLLISGADVTEIRQLEQQLRDSQRMDALGTLASGIAHDFNNILTSILGFAQLTHATLARGSKGATYLDRLMTSVERAKGLVQAILTFGRRARQTQRPSSLAAISIEALQLLRPSLPATITIRTQIEENCGAVLADPTQLHQLVMNLCTNAYQSMSRSGGVLEIVVEAHEVGLEEARSNPKLATGPHVRLRVSDTGPGMSEATKSRIFEPFFTTKRPGEGTGLGLSVVHGIVTQLEGTISVTSAPGEGACFEVLLPRCAEPALVSTNRPEEDDNVAHGDETILFVDDEPEVQRSVQGLLELLGYRTLTASNGDEALVQFKEHADEIDLVITDRAMPGMMGNELAAALRALRANLPIIMVTGGAMDSLPVEIVSRYLRKPFTKDDLGAAIRGAMPRRAAR